MATVHHYAGAGPWQPQPASSVPRGQGLLIFAAVMMGVLALFNGLDGIAAINRSHVFTQNATYVFGDLRAWGWAMLALAIAQAFTVVGILARVPVARWFGVVVLTLNAFAQMAFIPSYPVWSVLILALDVLAIYALIAHGSSSAAETTAQPAPEAAVPPRAGT
ncbi:hypothetical protein [Streptacidiphilus sp. EB129]|uniref:DUF7144 family membrane protein n=1 Tax=Streptacidiphilus sp. EB129 TaxID=3156262 RepID=UPI0035174FD2